MNGLISRTHSHSMTRPESRWVSTSDRSSGVRKTGIAASPMRLLTIQAERSAKRRFISR